MLRKTLVVGTSCSGKSTLAHEIGQILQIRPIDLDEIYWLPDWKGKEEDQFVIDMKSEILSHSKWIVSGNYLKTSGLLWQEADTVVWLNYPLPLILYRFFTRTVSRILYQKKVCGSNYESFYHSFMEKDNLFLWILRTYKAHRKRYHEWREHEFTGKRWIELTCQRDADELKQELRRRYLLDPMNS